jgi:actin, other eukaryote
MSEEFRNPNCQNQRQRTMQVIFETFCVPSFFLEQTSYLNLLSTGRTTGTVVDMGHTKNHVSCIFEGSVLPNAEISNFGGRDVETLLENAIKENHSKRNPPNHPIKFYLQEIKEKHCFVSSNIYNESEIEKKYELPDNTVLTKKNELFTAPELFFDKKRIEDEYTLPEMIKLHQSKRF